MGRMNTDLNKNIRANPSDPCQSVVDVNRTRIDTDVTDQHG